eukprot:gene409-biopygen627
MLPQNRAGCRAPPKRRGHLPRRVVNMAPCAVTRYRDALLTRHQCGLHLPRFVVQLRADVSEQRPVVAPRGEVRVLRKLRRDTLPHEWDKHRRVLQRHRAVGHSAPNDTPTWVCSRLPASTGTGKVLVKTPL